MTEIGQSSHDSLAAHNCTVVIDEAKFLLRPGNEYKVHTVCISYVYYKCNCSQLLQNCTILSEAWHLLNWLVTEALILDLWCVCKSLSNQPADPMTLQCHQCS